MRTHSGSASIQRCARPGRRGFDSDQHHPARGVPTRFHPLRKPDRLAGRGVPQRPRADLARPITRPRIQAHPQPQTHPQSRRLYFGRPTGFASSWDGQTRPDNSAKCMILQRNRGAPNSAINPVAGVLHAPAAVALHHPPPTAPTSSVMISRNRSTSTAARDVHRTHHIGRTAPSPACTPLPSAESRRLGHRTHHRTWRSSRRPVPHDPPQPRTAVHPSTTDPGVPTITTANNRVCSTAKSSAYSPPVFTRLASFLFPHPINIGLSFALDRREDGVSVRRA